MKHKAQRKARQKLQEEISTKKKNIKVKKGARFVALLLVMVTCAISLYGAYDLVNKAVRCKNTVVGVVTNAKIIPSSNPRKADRGWADLVIESDGVFPDSVLSIDSAYYARKEEIAVHYDPKDTSFYYLDGDLDEPSALMIGFAILAVPFILLFVYSGKVIKEDKKYLNELMEKSGLKG